MLEILKIRGKRSRSHGLKAGTKKWAKRVLARAMRHTPIEVDRDINQVVKAVSPPPHGAVVIDYIANVGYMHLAHGKAVAWVSESPETSAPIRKLIKPKIRHDHRAAKLLWNHAMGVCS